MSKKTYGYGSHGVFVSKHVQTRQAGHRSPMRPAPEAPSHHKPQFEDSLLKLIKEIPDVERAYMKSGFKDALEHVNMKLLEAKKLNVHSQADIVQSSDWKTKEHELLKEIAQLNEHIQRLQRQSTVVRSGRESGKDSKYEKVMDRLMHENDSMQKQLQSLKTEKKDLLHRLSKLAGAKLSDNNPDITDLSDPNRPQKLAQMFNELYDNQWTEAFESMSGSHDKGNIQVLLDIFMEIWKFCRDLGHHHLVSLENLMLHPWLTTHTIQSKPNADQYHTETMKSLKDSRKLASKETRKGLFEHFRDKHPTYRTLNEGVTRYAEKCVDLCWLCAIQDPPIEFTYNVKGGEKVDTQYFRLYDRSGETVEYLVWPAMLLHQDGAILVRGVVQAVKRKK
ncbi:uncharacterized protein LOC132558351 [Ylistrum balloti]|uniref:uncharacterized protein LOC132558351 n=1 Tax=Ylistrum balloti TaxID=509963 RepID=UPI0029059B18|nr:uncharacterized protein LOC132558351 [Ylistrum balloti]